MGLQAFQYAICKATQLTQYLPQEKTHKDLVYEIGHFVCIISMTIDP